MPPGSELYVIDDDEGERLPLIELSFGLRLTRDRSVRHLRIITGTSTYASEQTNGIALVPQKFEFQQNYPNPFNSTTWIRYQLSDTSPVRLDIYNALGQHFSTLVDAQQEAGWYEVNWDGRNEIGHRAASGIYFNTLQVGGITDTKSMVLFR